MVDEVVLRLVGRVAASVLTRYVHVQMAAIGVPAVADGSKHLAAFDLLPINHEQLRQVVTPGIVAVGVVLESIKITGSTVAIHILFVLLTRITDFIHNTARDRDDRLSTVTTGRQVEVPRFIRL